MKYISYSQINLYSQCGVQWYLRYKEKIAVPPSSPLIFGSKFHKALEENYRQKVGSGVDLPLDDLVSCFVEGVEEEFCGDVLLSADEKEAGKVAARDNMIEKGKAALDIYLKELAPLVQPLEIEKEFFADLGEGMPPLRGFIDLIADDLRVIDHKTSGKSPSSDEANNSQQLSAYALGFQSLYGFLPERLELQYTVTSPKKHIVKTSILPTTRTEEHVKRFIRRAKLAVNGIMADVYVPPPQGSWACGYCAYRDLGYCDI